MTTFRTHYDDLKVARDAPDLVIRIAYETLSDHIPTEEKNRLEAVRKLHSIQTAYAQLSAPQKRKAYDAWIAKQETQQQADLDARIKAQILAEDPSTPTDAEAVEIRKKITLLEKQRKEINSRIQAFKQRKQTEERAEGAKTLDRERKIAEERHQLRQKRAAREAKEQAVFSWIYERWRGLVFLICMLFTVYVIYQDSPAGNKGRQSTAQKSDSGNASTSTSSPPLPQRYTKPPKAPNGAFWPVFPGYINGYPILNNTGRSSVTIDNSRNSSDVFVKLFYLDGSEPEPVRHFYVPAYRQFTLKQVTAGEYDIRYQDLSSGELSRSESFDLTERSTYGGYEFSNITMTLYKIQNGNMQTYGLSEADFQ